MAAVPGKSVVIEYLDHVEIGVCARTNRLGKCRGIRPFFALISKLGDGSFWAVLAMAVLLAQGPAVIPEIIVTAVMTIAGVILYKFLKRRLIRERPYVSAAGSDAGMEALTAPLDRYSFPSGHTLHAVSLSMLLTHIEPMLFFVAWPFAILAALSRVILGLHYPSDVVVGALIGAALATFGIYLM